MKIDIIDSALIESSEGSPNSKGTDKKITVGISQCLLGEKVRFDGGHKHSRFCTKILAEHFDFVPSCPEVGAGMGIPRRPVRMIGDENAQRIVDSKDNSIDYTDALRDYSASRVPDLGHLSGYIFMAKSPSCGLFRVKVYAENGYAQASAPGIFARMFTEAYPLIPVEEEGRLNDPVLLENFLVRVVIYDQWKRLVQEGISAAGILAFHQRFKLQLMAHSVPAYKEAGRLLSDLKQRDLQTIADEYIAKVMSGLKKIATRRTHTNVLQHIRGFFKTTISKVEQVELSQLIDDYYQGLVPLVVPMTMIKHHIRSSDNEYIKSQLYLQPHPHKLGLRNRI